MNWNMANHWFRRWSMAIGAAKAFKDEREHYCNQAVIALAQHEMYLAQEWAGARK